MRNDGKFLAASWNEWLASEEGQAASMPDLAKDSSSRRYLENRLWRAFMAGAKLRGRDEED